jgi:hypothetical protein
LLFMRVLYHALGHCARAFEKKLFAVSAYVVRT